MFDVLDNFIPTAIQCALVIYTMNSIMSMCDKEKLYINLAWYSIKCSALVEQCYKSIENTLKYAGLITNKHIIDIVANGKNVKTIVLYKKNITDNDIKKIKQFETNNTDLVLYTSPETNNISNMIVADSLDNIRHSYTLSKNKMYSLTISWPDDNVADDNVADDNVADDNVVDDNVADDNVVDDNVVNDEYDIKKINIELPYNFCIEGNKLFTQPFMLWLLNKYNVPINNKYIRNYTVTFFDNKMEPYAITRKNNILIENNIFKIINEEINESDTDDSIGDNVINSDDMQNTQGNNWFNFFY